MTDYRFAPRGHVSKVNEKGEIEEITVHSYDLVGISHDIDLSTRPVDWFGRTIKKSRNMEQSLTIGPGTIMTVGEFKALLAGHPDNQPMMILLEDKGTDYQIALQGVKEYKGWGGTTTILGVLASRQNKIRGDGRAATQVMDRKSKCPRCGSWTNDGEICCSG